MCSFDVLEREPTLYPLFVKREESHYKRCTEMYKSVATNKLNI